jgi:hypothetical protein
VSKLADTLGRIEKELVQMQVQHAVRQARMAPRSDFARTLVRHLPGTPTHIWVDLALLRDEELQLVAEGAGV